MFSSERLIQGEVYSRAMLAKFFDIAAAGAINTGVVQPDRKRFRSIWLFVTEEKESNMTQFRDKLEGDCLLWQGQSEQGTDSLIINHKKSGLELLVFYRKTKRQHPNAGFVYEGQFEYESHVQHSKPTDFRFRRSKQHLALPPSEKIELALLEAFLEQSLDLESVYFLAAVLWLLREAKGLNSHFIPTSLIAAYIVGNTWLAANLGGPVLKSKRRRAIRVAESRQSVKSRKRRYEPGVCNA